MAHCYHLHTILSIRHPQQAYVIPFTAYLPGGSSTAYPLCLLVQSAFSFSCSTCSLTLPRKPSALNARIWREIKSINPLTGLVNPSHTVHHSLWPCNSSPLALCLWGSLIPQLSIWMAVGTICPSPGLFCQPLIRIFALTCGLSCLC